MRAGEIVLSTFVIFHSHREFNTDSFFSLLNVSRSIRLAFCWNMLCNFVYRFVYFNKFVMASPFDIAENLCLFTLPLAVAHHPMEICSLFFTLFFGI